MTGEFLVPLLRTDGGYPDPIAIETWHLALGSTIAVELPHDLFALWLFPGNGGVVMLGPEGLAVDRVEVPAPDPMLPQEELFRLEERLRQAKYPSAMAAPIRHGGRDVGLMLLGSFARGVFGPAQAVALQRLGARLGPTMADLAAKMPAVSSRPLLEPNLTRENLVEHLARAACEAINAADLLGRASGLLYPLLPHDRLEVLVPGTVPDSYIGLSGVLPRRRWGGPGGAPGPGGNVEPLAAIVPRFGEGPTLLVSDVSELELPLEWSGGSHPLPARSLLGARMTVGRTTVGYLIIGSVAGDGYRPEDEDLLALAALVLAPRVATLRTAGEAAPRPPLSAPSEEPPIRRAAAALAGTASLEEGLRTFAAELHGVLPHRGISIHLRRGETEVVSLDPEALRPIADLPAVRLREFEGAPLLEGEDQWLVLARRDRDEVLVPLRVAGRVVGTLGVRTAEPGSSREAAALALQFADLLAPHLELLRRGAASPPVSRSIRAASVESQST